MKSRENKRVRKPRPLRPDDMTIPQQLALARIAKLLNEIEILATIQFSGDEPWAIRLSESIKHMRDDFSLKAP